MFNKIDKRNLYRLVDWKSFHWKDYKKLNEMFTPKLIVAKAQELCRESNSDEERQLGKTLKDSHVIVDISQLHFGMKEKNPLHAVRFYSKHDRTGEIFNVFSVLFNEYSI